MQSLNINSNLKFKITYTKIPQKVKGFIFQMIDENSYKKVQYKSMSIETIKQAFEDVFGKQV